MKKMKKILTNINYFWLILIGFSALTSLNVKAEEAGIGFSVVPILPMSQIDKELGYYYLETKAGEEQVFEVKLSSQKDEKQKVKMFVEDAYTGTTGNLTYGVDGQNSFKQDKTLTNSTSQIIKPVSETIELGSREQKTVSFKLKAPKESYEGVKIGRLVFKSVNENDEEGNTAVVEDYQYAVSVILSENGDDYNDGNIQDISLNEVKATVKRGKRLVTANLQNPQPKRILNLDLSANVTKKGSDKVIKQTKIPEFQFAPNSNVDLEVDWGLSELEAGEYTINISGVNEYDKIHLTKDFRITTEAAKKLNKESAFKIETPTWVKISAITSGVLTSVAAVAVLKRNKKWMKMSRRKRKSKQRNKKK